MTRMGSNNNQINEKQTVAPAPRVTFCQRKKSENGSFVGTLRNHFHEFIHASMDEHKRCLINTIHKLCSKQIFGRKNDSPRENDISLPLQSTTKD
ncbi:ADP-ribosylation factor-like 2 [Senna tora]|uniref:ADP-ribosylation factor-like 2 n=1 Tax=Senna tora TaxID=362788 RepID=A0A834TY86_9FABA|nr:ADP-ribosylation factor-like 2 [Senna tora]